MDAQSSTTETTGIGGEGSIDIKQQQEEGIPKHAKSKCAPGKGSEISVFQSHRQDKSNDSELYESSGSGSSKRKRRLHMDDKVDKRLKKSPPLPLNGPNRCDIRVMLGVGTKRLMGDSPSANGMGARERSRETNRREDATEASDKPPDLQRSESKRSEECISLNIETVIPQHLRTRPCQRNLDENTTANTRRNLQRSDNWARQRCKERKRRVSPGHSNCRNDRMNNTIKNDDHELQEESRTPINGPNRLQERRTSARRGSGSLPCLKKTSARGADDRAGSSTYDGDVDCDECVYGVQLLPKKCVFRRVEVGSGLPLEESMMGGGGGTGFGATSKMRKEVNGRGSKIEKDVDEKEGIEDLYERKPRLPLMINAESKNIFGSEQTGRKHPRNPRQKIGKIMEIKMKEKEEEKKFDENVMTSNSKSFSTTSHERSNGISGGATNCKQKSKRRREKRPPPSRVVYI